ncbi:MAG: UDP-N-acetylglucosamine--N-acetylmuramyl-(pentapeptide) pyrophosphoryl-undecaprenol N-acetylglucosamine transferase, partial [Streptococcus sp.]
LNHELEQLVEHAETYKEAMAKSEEITSPDDFYNLLVTSISKK